MLLLFARTHLSCPVHQPGRNHATRVVKVIQENWNKETKEILKRNFFFFFYRFPELEQNQNKHLDHDDNIITLC